MDVTNSTNTLDKYTKHYDRDRYTVLNESMTFDEYLAKCLEKPRLLRNAYQYVYDMIMEKGTESFTKFRKTYTRYKFFTSSRTKIYGLEESLDAIVNYLEGAAGGYGTQKRFLLLHGPVGSSKSTICRSIKEGLESYSRTDDGAWYTFDWVNLPPEVYAEDTCRSALRENPVKLLPKEILEPFLKDVNAKFVDMHEIDGEKRHQAYDLKVEGELNPRCKMFMQRLLAQYNGDWKKVVDNHVRVVRLAHSESDRVGIGTFQPKDEKNQDSTELTGDVNFRNIGLYGSDSDPRAFNFDGEFEVGNRGMIEFIEALKLQNEFLYDLLEATQDHSVKPKKFSRISVDELIIGHSVHGDTPIPHEYNGVLDVLPISKMASLDTSKLRVFSVNEETRVVELTEVKSVFNHDFEGEWIENRQNGESITTTPNHSVYNENYETFYPGEDESTSILQVKIPSFLVEGKQKTERWNRFFE